MESIITKKCTKCGEEKTISQYSKDVRGLFGVVSNCKQCISKKGKEWNKNHKEKVKKSYQKYLDVHGKRENNKEYHKEYRAKNKDKISLMSKVWQAINADRVKEKLKEWKKRNPEKISQYNNNRRALYKGKKGIVSSVEWKNILDNYGNKCLCCGVENVVLTMDHVVPLSMGGEHKVDNIQPLCKKCNSSKHTKTIDYRF